MVSPRHLAENPGGQGLGCSLQSLAFRFGRHRSGKVRSSHRRFLLWGKRRRGLILPGKLPDACFGGSIVSKQS